MLGRKPDLEGVRRVAEDVGALPVPRSIREARGERLPPIDGPSLDGARVAERPASSQARRRSAARRPAPVSDAERAARLRRSSPRAARTPEELGAALGRVEGGGPDPQRGREAGPPRPGERGVHGDDG